MKVKPVTRVESPYNCCGCVDRDNKILDFEERLQRQADTIKSLQEQLRDRAESTH